MRYSTVLIFGLFAITPFITGCDVSECNSYVNLTLIGKEFAAGAKSYPQPIYVYDQALAGTYQESFIKICIEVADTIQKLVYTMAKQAGQNLIKNITDCRDSLRSSIKSIKNINSAVYLDDDLKCLKNQCDIFLATIPGNALIKRRGLPELPPLPTGVLNITEQLTLSDLFVNLDRALDMNWFVGYNFTVALLLSGWDNARLHFNEVQEQHRNAILNIKVLPDYAKVIEEIYKKSDVIQNNVKEKATWKAFKVVGDRILSIFKDWTTSRINKYCST